MSIKQLSNHVPIWLLASIVGLVSHSLSSRRRCSVSLATGIEDGDTDLGGFFTMRQKKIENLRVTNTALLFLNTDTCFGNYKDLLLFMCYV